MDPVENFIDSDTEGEQEPSDADSDQSLSTESSGSDYETEDEDEDGDCVDCKDCNPLYGKDKTKWSSVILNSKVKTATAYLPDTTGIAKEKKTPLDCWLLFFNEETLNDIVNYTNTKIATKASSYSACHHNMVKKTNLCELKALLGLVYLSGLFGRARENSSILWSKGLFGIEVFPKTMSRERFLFLLQCIRFDDINDRAQRRNIDKLAPIRRIYDKFLESSQSYYTPSEHLTLCKKLEPFEGRSSFLQCSSKNTDKHGLKIFTLVDIKTYYCVNMEVYVNDQPEGIYHKSNRRGDIVERLIAPLSGTNRNITFDKWFTSYSLMMTLLKTHKLTSVGAVKKKKKEIPKALLRTTHRKTSSSFFAFQKDITAVSYMAFRTTNIVFLSTLHHDSALINKKFPPNLPKIIDFYDSAEYEIYKLNESLAAYDVAQNTRRWPLMLFFIFLNMAAVNAHVIYTLNKKVSRKKVSLHRFLKDLALQLINEFKAQKSENPCCSFCPDEKGYKAAYSCEQCGTPVCSEHVNFMCEDCDKSTSDDI